MIGYLEGKVLCSDGKKILLLAQNGVGYEVNFAYFIALGSEASVYIHHHISENDQSLWGFNTLEDKKMFELLKSVNKVGSSKAYPLVTQVGVKNLISAITFEQIDILTQAPGIGKKMAEQIILSLKDKIEKLEVFKAQDLARTGDDSDQNVSSDNALDIDKGVFQEALRALDSLGYKDKQVASLLSSKYDDSVKTSEELIKLALRDL
ncbi:MAG: Holliday junction branch migration protein RuvA [Bacteriovoracaceae bacterium]